MLHQKTQKEHKPAGLSWLQCTTRRDQCWVLTQQNTSIAKPFRENVAALVLFYTPSGKTTKAIFEDYAGELSHEKYQELIAQLKKHKFSFIVFNHRYPYGIKINNI